MKRSTIFTESGRSEYCRKTFTKDGLQTLSQYVNQLAKIYVRQTFYPFKLGLILGVPMMQYAQVIKTKEHLMERIKAYSQILGINEVIVHSGTSIITIELGGQK